MFNPYDAKSCSTNIYHLLFYRRNVQKNLTKFFVTVFLLTAYIIYDAFVQGENNYDEV